MANRKVVLTKSNLEALSEQRFYFDNEVWHRLKEGDPIFFEDDCEVERYTHLLRGHEIPRRYGCFSFSRSALHTVMDIGRYCSIAQGLVVLGEDHPLDRVSTSPFTYKPQGLLGFEKSITDAGRRFYPMAPFAVGQPRLTLGHDVWIGEDCGFKRNLTIGTGAVIGARSLVTKDVPPYVIVAGTPARVIRYRFSEKVIEAMLRLAWWDYHFNDIVTLPQRTPEELVASLAEAAALGNLEKFKPGHVAFDALD